MSTRFLLDEHLSPVITEQLLARSIDAEAVSSRPDLRTQPDPDILEAAASEGRVLVTRNVRDFIRLDTVWARGGRRHAGTVRVASRRYPADSSFVGALTTALAELAAVGRDISDTYWFL